jgi:hypothetical protein
MNRKDRENENDNYKNKNKYLLYKPLYLATKSKQFTSKITEKCQTISYFFDNDPYNFIDSYLCPCIKPVEVNESSPLNPENKTFHYIYTTDDVIKGYCDGLSRGARQFAEAMLLLGEAQSYDPISGISKEQFRYYTSLAKSSNNIKAFIFDWDRTLTVIEGIYAIKPTVRQMLRALDLPQVNVMDVVEFYFGGNYRICQLQRLWNTLRNRNIDIWVLSSNPAIGNMPLFFLELLEAVGLSLRPDHLCFRGELTKYQFMYRYL